MVLITRKVGESIHIGKDIKISILSQHGNVLRFGVSSPKDPSVVQAND